MDAVRSRLALPESGIEIALLDWGGEGPLALLHHANGFCAALWEPVALALRERFRVVAMDARGHGDSSKPEGRDAYHWAHFGRDARAVAGTLADAHGPVALGLGHSFGGTALVLAAIGAPALFERLVLLDPIVLPTSPESLAFRREGRKAMAEGARRRRHVWESREQARAAWQGKAFFADWDPRVFELYLDEAMADRPDGQVELKCSGEVEAFIYEQNDSVPVMDEARRLEAPALVLWAKRGTFPRSHFEELASRMPDGRVRDADAGHLIPMEDPQLAVHEALAFGASRSPASAAR